MRKPYVGLEIYADAAEGVRLGFFGFEDFFMGSRFTIRALGLYQW